MIPKAELQTIYAYHKERIENEFWREHGRLPRIVRFPITRKWLDMILSGEKREEYREKKPYWEKRIWIPGCDIAYYHAGYNADSPAAFVEVENVRIGYGKPEWGAPVDEQVFICELGDIIQTVNI